MSETEATSGHEMLERKLKLDRRLERKLLSGKKTLRRIRLGVGGVMVFIGLGCAAVAESLIRVGWTAEPLAQVMLAAVQALLFQLRYFALNLAPLADDVSFTRCILVMELAINILTMVTNWFTYIGVRHDLHEPEGVDRIQRALVICHLVWAGVLACGLLVAIAQRGAQQVQRFMWKALSLCLWLRVVSLTAASCALLALGRFDDVGSQVGVLLIYISANLLTLYLISRPRLRQAVQARLGRAFTEHSAARAAAGLACLMRGGSTRMVLEEARRRFRVVSLACLAFEDIETNTPDSSLFSRTAAAQLGHCDAFVSHSWHDNAAAKWEALQLWRDAFVRRHGREPSVWFDKFCIDQQDIDANLRSLPVFLSGCKKLIILYGPTYLERLWCVLEVFTFAHIGGSWDRVELLPVLRPGHSDDDNADVEAAIQDFAVQNCECFLKEDKERMVMIILTAYGSLDAFSNAVRSLFGNGNMKQDSSGSDVSAADEEIDTFACSDTSVSTSESSDGHSA